MADDKLKAGPEVALASRLCLGRCSNCDEAPCPWWETVEEPAAGTGPVRQPEQSVTPGMGGDVPRPACSRRLKLIRWKKVPPTRIKKWNRRKRRQNAGAVPPRSRILPRGTNRKRGRSPAQAARQRLTRRPVAGPRPQLWTKCPEVRNKSLPPPSAEEKHAGNAIKM